MKFGAITFIWASPFTTAELGVVGRVARAGYDVIEVAVEEAGALDGAALRAGLDEHGLDVIVIGFGTAGRDLSSSDGAERTAGLDYARACVDLAASVGAEVLCGPLHSAVGKARVLEPSERRAERERAVDGLRQVVSYAGEHGISVALEPLNRFENDMLNTVAQGLDLCDAVGLENVGLLLDTFHMNVEEKHIGEALRAGGCCTFTPLRTIAVLPAAATSTGTKSGMACRRSDTTRSSRSSRSSRRCPGCRPPSRCGGRSSRIQTGSRSSRSPTFIPCSRRPRRPDG